MKIKKLPNRYKIVKPFKVTRNKDKYYEIKNLSMWSFSTNKKEAIEELYSQIIYSCDMFFPMKPSEMSKTLRKQVKILKKHIRVMF